MKNNRRKRQIKAIERAKQPISMREFAANVRDLAAKYGEKYYTAGYQVTGNHDGTERAQFACYINGGIHAYGITPAAALYIQRDAMAHLDIKPDVLVEEPGVSPPATATEIKVPDDLPF